MCHRAALDDRGAGIPAGDAHDRNRGDHGHVHLQSHPEPGDGGPDLSQLAGRTYRRCDRAYLEKCQLAHVHDPLSALPGSAGGASICPGDAVVGLSS